MLIRKIAEEFSISEETASEYIRNIFNNIIRTLSSGKNVNIAEFGKFLIRNNKISFSPVKRFAKEINFNYAELETIKIRNYNEKEFREKFNRLKKVEEEIEVQLESLYTDESETFIPLPEPPVPKVPEMKTEKPGIQEEVIVKEQIPEEKKEKAPGDYMVSEIIPETVIPPEEEITEDEVTEEDIEEAVKSAIDEFLKTNFPEKTETPAKEEHGEVKRTLPEILADDKIISEEILKDPKEFKPLSRTIEKPTLGNLSDFIVNKEPYIKEEEIRNIKQVIRESESGDKDVAEKPSEAFEDIEKFIIRHPAERKEEISEAEVEMEDYEEPVSEEEITGEQIADESFISGITEESGYGAEEIISGIAEEKPEPQKEFPERIKDVEDELSRRIEEAKTYKDKVFNKNNLDDLIAEREKIISEIKISTEYTIEPFRPDEHEDYEEPPPDVKKEEKKPGISKTLLFLRMSQNKKNRKNLMI